MTTFKTETSTGILEFNGTPVANDFDYKNFAFLNGFNNLKIYSPENTKKYGGVGFVTFKNHSDDSDLCYSDKKILEILFVNGLPVMYSIK